MYVNRRSEAIEYNFLFLFRDTNARIPHIHANIIVLKQLKSHFNEAIGGELNGILDQVHEHLLQPGSIGVKDDRFFLVRNI